MKLEKITVQQMDEKGVCSAPNVLSGTPAQNKAVFDRMVRELIAPAYNAAVDAINEINQTENGIEAAEALRVSAENLRVAAENARAQAESGRVTAEQARASAENLRVEAENLREAAETARSKAESGRVTAEKARESAEATRVVNENQRIENENARIEAEQARVNETNGIVAQATAQAQAAAASAAIAEQIAIGSIPDGTIPEEKLVQEVQNAIDRAKVGGAIDSVLSSKPNQSLIDNGVFWPGCLVDQRGGYVALPGIPYYDTMWGNIIGYFDTYTPVNSGPSYANDEYATYIVGDTTYYVPKDAGNLGMGFVRGYTGAGYGLDRWKMYDLASVLIYDDGIILTTNGTQYGRIVQLMDAKFKAGMVVTLSVLVEEMSTTGAWYMELSYQDTSGTEKYIGYTLLSVGLNMVTVNIPDDYDSKYPMLARFPNNRTVAGDMIKLKAAKLELGSQQTLAHQDENGNWVLNEIPNYAEELAKCQRYYYRMSADASHSVFGTGTYWSGNCMFVIPFHTTMRTVPVFSYSGSFILVGGPSVIAVSSITSDGQNRENSTNCACITVQPGASISVAPYILQANNDTSAYLEWTADL